MPKTSAVIADIAADLSQRLRAQEDIKWKLAFPLGSTSSLNRVCSWGAVAKISAIPVQKCP